MVFNISINTNGAALAVNHTRGFDTKFSMKTLFPPVTSPGNCGNILHDVSGVSCSYSKWNADTLLRATVLVPLLPSPFYSDKKDLNTRVV